MKLWMQILAWIIGICVLIALILGAFAIRDKVREGRSTYKCTETSSTSFNCTKS